MPRLCQSVSPSDLNDYIRYDLGPRLSPADKRMMALYLGVSYRTVNNWTTLTGRGTNFVSNRLPTADPSEWPGRYAERGSWALYARDGYRGPYDYPGANTRTYVVTYTDPASGVADFERWGTSPDRFEAEAILSASLVGALSVWEAVVTYAVEWYETPIEPVKEPVCGPTGPVLDE